MSNPSFIYLGETNEIFEIKERLGKTLMVISEHGFTIRFWLTKSALKKGYVALLGDANE